MKIEIISGEEMKRYKGNFYLNPNTHTLHIIGNCCHTKGIYSNGKIFSTEDEAIQSETRYMRHCKLCFKK